jgi:hypothetical protein
MRHRSATAARRRAALLLAVCVAASVLLSVPAAALTGSGTWNHVGTNGASPPGSALNGHVYETVTAGGALYAGGRFTNAGGIGKADLIAKWNGTAWRALGTSPIASTGAVFAIAVDGNKVYAGGTFTDAGGEPAADYLAVFDGVSWEPFCNATSDPTFNTNGMQVLALELIGSTLYVGGSFQNANGVAVADYLIGCDVNTGVMTTTISNGGSFSGAVYDLTSTPDGTLYAGGTFSNLDQIPEADFVAAYDGAWSSLGTTPIGGYVRALHASGTDVYVGTDGVDIGGEPRADHLVRWDGVSYAPVEEGTNGSFPTSASIYEITTAAGLVIVGGSWQDMGGVTVADHLSYFRDGRWHSIGTNGATPANGALNSSVEALSVYEGQLFAGGGATSIGGDPKAHFLGSRSLRLPDAFTLNSDSIGRHIYNKTGAGQVRHLSIERGATKSTQVCVENRGVVAAAFRAAATGRGDGYRTTYRRGGDITAAVKDGTYLSSGRVPDDRVCITMEVTLGGSAAKSASFLIRWSSIGPGTAIDVVKVVVTAK